MTPSPDLHQQAETFMAAFATAVRSGGPEPYLRKLVNEFTQRVQAETREEDANERCKCGVAYTVSHYCSSLDHAWLPSQPLLRARKDRP